MDTSYIYFGLAGDFDPTDLSKEIDLDSTYSSAKHSKDPVRKLPRCSLMRFAQINSNQNSSELDVYKLADEVVDQLEPFTEQFAVAIEKYQLEATFQVVFWYPVSEEKSTPVLGFSNRVIQFLAATGAFIDIDGYRERI